MKSLIAAEAEICTALKEHIAVGACLVGELRLTPGLVGCFEREQQWFVYTVGDHTECSISGPFDAHGIICACLLKLHVKNDAYRFSREEQDIYINNRFASLQEVDTYLKEHTNGAL